jgi:hypothetical protein
MKNEKAHKLFDFSALYYLYYYNFKFMKLVILLLQR